MSIAITGLGIISAIGNGKEQTLHALRTGQGGVATMQHLHSKHRELPVGEVKLSNAQLAAMLSLPNADTISRTALLGAVALKQAINDAGGPQLLEAKRIAFVNGTTVGGMDITEQVFADATAQADSKLDFVLHHDCGSSSNDIIHLLGIDCTVTTVSTACSSALNAIARGADMLQSGQADIVLAGGTEALSLFHLNGFNTLLILDHDRCRPFDKSRAGINLGEGAAYLVMQRTEDLAQPPQQAPTSGANASPKEPAQKAPTSGANASLHAPLAYITGYGNACDAYHQTASSENGEGAYRAMTEALRQANLTPADIDYVNAHGTGTPNNDASESAALRRVFGTAMPPVSSTKAFTGHTTSASGSIEAAICILAMQQGFIPPSLGWTTQDDTCITPCQQAKEATISHALCNAFGFGGNDSALIISRQAPTTEPATPTSGAYASPQEPTAPTSGANASPQEPKPECVAEVIIDTPEQLKDYKDIIKPMEARRMGTLLKAATLTSVKALRMAGIDTPDAIVTATCYGMLETSEKFLTDLCHNGEDLLKPTLFMQSTHNTVGSSIAIRTHCHGYNITYSQGLRSMECAMEDARRLIASGRAKTVLVGLHDEATPTLRSLLQRLGQPVPPEIYSRALVLRAL